MRSHKAHLYLNNYLVLDNRNTTLHQLYECHRISNFLTFIFNVLNMHCKTTLSLEESRDDYIFGFQGTKYEALNQILLELKVFNFYYTRENPQQLSLIHI